MGMKIQMVSDTEIPSLVRVLQLQGCTAPQHENPLMTGLIKPVVSLIGESIGADQVEMPTSSLLNPPVSLLSCVRHWGGEKIFAI